MRPSHFVERLCALQFVNTFNPYSNHCLIHDLEDAPLMRAATLLAVLKAAADSKIDAIWIGRDLGYRGGRRTGLALTDDVHINAHAERWGIAVERPTKGGAVSERTAAVIWNVLFQIDVPVFLWNVFPLHPHKPADPFSNRSHNAHERKAGEEILIQLILLLRPRRLIAIGNDAANAARRLAGDVDVIQVRHPSYGGQTQFLEQMRELYGLPDADTHDSLL
jgi:hypothetical protein